MTAYLLILGEREAVAWVLRESRMAFPPTNRREVDRLTAGDELFLLTTRGCWHNPTRDRTRVIGRGWVTGPVEPYDRPVRIAGRDFTRGCAIEIDLLTPYLRGVELARLLPRLAAFPDKRPGAWSIRLRRPLLALPGADADLLRAELTRIAAAPGEVAGEYLDKIRPVRRAGSAARAG